MEVFIRYLLKIVYFNSYVIIITKELMKRNTIYLKFQIDLAKKFTGNEEICQIESIFIEETVSNLPHALVLKEES